MRLIDALELKRSISVSAVIGDEKHIFDIIDEQPTIEPEIVRCKDCKHRPVTNNNYDDDELDCGFNIEFPDYRCPCQCDDGYYNRLPDDNWFCGNAERRTK